MKLLHTLKSGKTNEIPLTLEGSTTRHKVKQGSVVHEGWAIVGVREEKEHKYSLVFSPEEAQKFHDWLGQQLERFKTDSFEELEQHIKEETHG